MQGNFIGTNVNGTTALGNAIGVFISNVPNNTIGGTATGARNVISGNTMVGVDIQGSSATGNLVQGNLIGTNVTGTAVLGTSSVGVRIRGGASTNTIGGTTPGAENVISGNFMRGVDIEGSDTTGNLVQGNFIGTDVTGTLPLGNGAGMRIYQTSSNIIGGTTPGAGNVISGNSGVGIEIQNGATGNLLQGNFIGTQVDGTSPLGNTWEGVFIASSSNNIIGGAASGAGNTIAFNGRDGVFVITGTGNAILSNSIFSNGGLGIDLGTSGVRANDLGDVDTGPNNLQNFPVLTSATSGSTTIEGTLNSTANTQFRLEFFANTAPDPSGHGEGESFIGSADVTTDGSGNVIFTVIFPATVPAGQLVAATATDPDNNTSEFSGYVTTVPAAFLVVLIDIKPGSDPNSINLGDEGLLPVAVLGSGSFDVTTMDPATIVLGGVDLATRGSAKAPKLAFSYEDVNLDGYTDLVAFFSVQDLVDVGALTETTVALTLTANLFDLFDGTPIEGADSVNVVP